MARKHLYGYFRFVDKDGKEHFRKPTPTAMATMKKLRSKKMTTVPERTRMDPATMQSL